MRRPFRTGAVDALRLSTLHFALRFSDWHGGCATLIHPTPFAALF